MIFEGVNGYSERGLDPGSPTSGIYTNTVAASVPQGRVYTLGTGESTIDDILNRLEKTDNVVLIRFPRGSIAKDTPTRVIMGVHFAAGSTDEAIANDPVYGLRAGNLGGKECVFVEKLWDREVTPLVVTGRTVGGGAAGGGKTSGTQIVEGSSTLTSTGVIEAITGGAVEPKAFADGDPLVSSGVSGVALVDRGPYIALMRTPFIGTNATGMSLLHQLWR